VRRERRARRRAGGLPLLPALGDAAVVPWLAVRNAIVISSAVPILTNATAALRASPRRFARFTGEPLKAALNDG
jgi:hypothetical protein